MNRIESTSTIIEIGMEEELRKLIRFGKLNNKKIYVMGSLYNIHRVNCVLIEFGLKITGGLDNNTNKHGKYIFDGNEYSLSSPDILNEMTNFCVLIFSIRFWGEMRDQMSSMNLKIDKDFYILEAPILRKKIRYIYKGYKIYKKLHERFAKNTYILLFHGPIGDNYLFAGFYKQFLKKNNIKSWIWVGTGATEKIAQVYKIDNFVKLNREEIISLEFLYMFLGDNILKMKILQIWEFEFHFNRCRIRFDEKFNFMDTYRHYVYDLPENTQFYKPSFLCNEDKLKSVFINKKLSPKKTVIIAPYAYSIEQKPPEIFWNTLAKKLELEGYSICVNIIPGIEENFIANAEVLEFDLSESVKYLEYAGCFIGMRSGLCDVISSADCKKVILYPARYSKIIDYDRHRPDMDFGGLNNMGLCEDAIELEFTHCKDTDDLYWQEFADNIIENIKMNNTNFTSSIKSL